MAKAANPRIKKQTLTVEEAGKVMGVSRKKAYQLAHDGTLPIIKIGRLLKVSLPALEQRLLAAGDLDRLQRPVSPASIEEKNLEAAG